MGLTNLILLYGFDRFLDEIFGLVVKLGWLTAILGVLRVMKQTLQSGRNVTGKIMLIFVTVLSFALVSAMCLLLLPNSLVSATNQFDVKPLLGLGSTILWLTIALDIQAVLEARKPQSEISIGKMMVVLFVPIIGAGYYLINNKAREIKA